MGALIPLALQAVPWLVDMLTGSSVAKEATQAVVDVATAVTGEADPDRAAAALQADPAKLSEFTVQMEAKKNELYALQTARLVAEQGNVDAATLATLDKKDAGRVAWLRMTTRPWTVRWCVRALVFPPLAIITVDGVLSLVNLLAAGLGWLARIPVIVDKTVDGVGISTIVGDRIQTLHFDLLAPTLLNADSGFVALYSWFAPSATSIVLGYMGLREIGKARDQGVTVKDAAGAVGGIVRRVFGR